MKHTPHSVSWDENLDSIIAQRRREEGMTVSEYIRKCVREEHERAQAKRILRLADNLPSITKLAA